MEQEARVPLPSRLDMGYSSCVLRENEEKWINYDEEETEVGVELADMVFEDLVSELSEEFRDIRKKEVFL